MGLWLDPIFLYNVATVFILLYIIEDGNYSRFLALTNSWN
jgi:hypothetical protein